MPNLKNYKLSEICSIFDEAIRSIPGYESYDPQKEVKANIHYDLTHQNVALRLNECMLTKGKKKKSGRLDEFYLSKLGKKPRKNAVATYRIKESVLTLYIADDQKPWCPSRMKQITLILIILKCRIEMKQILWRSKHENKRFIKEI